MPRTPPTRDDVVQAAERVRPRLRRTPVLQVDAPTPQGSIPLVLKLESLQVTGSFKPRGALNSLLSTDADEVVACSGGNHGLAVAWAASELQRSATVVVPASAARSKVDAMRALGARVIERGDTPGEAFALADELVADTGFPLVHPYDQAPTVAGQGSLGIEVVEDAPHVTHWLVAVGGGGLLAGMSLAVADAAALVPVETERCPTLFSAQRAGHPVPTPAEGLARTSLGAPSIGDIAWAVLADRVPTCTLVTDDAVRDAQRWLWREARLVAEPGGATTLAAVMSGAWTPPEGAVVGVLVCGGNVDALPDAAADPTGPPTTR
jgi:threonine dehydratase